MSMMRPRRRFRGRTLCDWCSWMNLVDLVMSRLSWWLASSSMGTALIANQSNVYAKSRRQQSQKKIATGLYFMLAICFKGLVILKTKIHGREKGDLPYCDP